MSSYPTEPSGNAPSSGGSDEQLIIDLIRRAFDLRDEGVDIDLEDLCDGDQELIQAVRGALDIDAALPRDPGERTLSGVSLQNRYRLTEQIGAGAMGVVYSAADEVLEREVAIKILQPDLFATQTRRERFQREARVLALLDHPGVVRIFDHGTSEQGLDFIVMERLRGASMQTLIEREQPWLHGDGVAPSSGQRPLRTGYLREMVGHVADLASALQSAHAGGVLHRDIKPSNCWVTDAGRAVLLDFGIAAREESGELTAEGSTIGTPWYMPPEQVQGPKTTTPASDVYSLSATLYHLATLRPPYEGERTEVLTRLAQHDPPPPRKIRPELPRDLCAILERGMERDPRRRYQTAAALEADLRAFLDHRPVIARPIGPVQRTVRRIRRRPMPLVAGLLVVLAVAVTLVSTRLATRVAEARRERANTQFVGLLTLLSPSVEFAETPSNRERLQEVWRPAQLSILDRLLTVRPESTWTRLARSALRLDAGLHAAAASDLRNLSGSPGPYLTALVRRYHEADRAKTGLESIELDGLPDPITSADHLVAALHRGRLRTHREGVVALRHLDGADPGFARSYLRITILLDQLDRVTPAERTRLTETLRGDIDLVTKQLGSETPRTLHARSLLHALDGEWAAALALAAEGARRSVDPFPFLLNTSFYQLRIDQPQLAAEAAAQALALRPWSILAALNLVDSHFANGDLARSREAVARLAKTDASPGLRARASALTSLLQVFASIRAGDLSRAADFASESEDLFRRIPLVERRNDDQVRTLLARSIARNDLSQASEAILQLAHDAPLSPAVLQILGDVLVMEQDPTPSLMDGIRSLLIQQAEALAPRVRSAVRDR